jgi:DNA repair exonuclease SbcCD nuclease subunit
VNLLRTAEPVAVPDLPVRLFPCPCRHRTAIDDPTGWIAGHRREGGEIRIGIAHGSLQIMPNLPEDDHPIAADAAERLDLDYLALGHWHKPLRHQSGRTAYPGTHEPMRFPGETAGASIGWEPHGGGDDERFADNGHGASTLVEITGPNAVPELTTIDVGRLQWRAERLDVTGRGYGELFRMFDEQPDYDRVVLRMALDGVADPRLHRRLHELGKIIVDRYHPGSSFDADAVLVEPDPDELRSAVGDGVLARVLDRLQAADQRDDPISRHALKLLYRLAWEDRPQ